MEHEISENTFLLKIEGKIYFIYESYILKGYTFAIYKSLKCKQKRNYYINFNNNFQFVATKYHKNILKFYQYNTINIISLNGKSIMMNYGGDNIKDKIFKNEIKLCDKFIRKQKLKNIYA